MTIDFNTAGEQRGFSLIIPDRTIVPVQLVIHPGDVGEGGWLTRSKDGAQRGACLRVHRHRGGACEEENMVPADGLRHHSEPCGGRRNHQADAPRHP